MSPRSSQASGLIEDVDLDTHQVTDKEIEADTGPEWVWARVAPEDLGDVRVVDVRSSVPRVAAPVQVSVPSNPDRLPPLLLIAEVARLLRTTDKAIYARMERGLLPGVVKARGGRILVDRDVLLRELRRGRAR